MSPFSVPITGLGTPDYTREVSDGRERPGIYLKFNQILVIFAYTPTDLVVHPYLVPWVKPVLAPGATAHMVDVATGVDTPYTIPEGYAITMVEKGFNFNQDVESWVYFDGLLVSNPILVSGGTPLEYGPLLGYSSLTLDPTAAFSHIVDVTIINRGGGNMKGGYEMVFILEEVGSPPLPTTKNVRCPFCTTVQEVNVGITEIICSKCGQKFMVRDYSKIRKS